MGLLGEIVDNAGIGENFLGGDGFGGQPGPVMGWMDGNTGGNDNGQAHPFAPAPTGDTNMENNQPFTPATNAFADNFFANSGNIFGGAVGQAFDGVQQLTGQQTQQQQQGCKCGCKPKPKKTYTCEEKCAYGRKMGIKCKGCRPYKKRTFYRKKTSTKKCATTKPKYTPKRTTKKRKSTYTNYSNKRSCY